MKKVIFRCLFCFSIVLQFCFCEKPVTGVLALFPGPGFEKGWSWYGMPETVERDSLAEQFFARCYSGKTPSFRQLGNAVYYRGSVKDTAFTVIIGELSPSYDADPALQAGFSVNADSTGSNEICFIEGSYAVYLRSNNESSRIQKAMRTVAVLIAERIE